MVGDTDVVADHRFSIIYDGPELQSGRMSVRELAPALLATSDAFNAAARIVNPDASLPGLAMSATDRGSFHVLLHVTEPGFVDHIVDLLSARETVAVIAGAELIRIAVDAFRLLLKMSGRLIRRIHRDRPRPGQIAIEFDDGTTFETSEEVYDLVRDSDFRTAAHDMVEPLRPDAIETFTISDETNEVTVHASERNAFHVPPPADELLLDTTATSVVRLISIAFQDDNKWRVSDGDSAFWVRIADLEFLSRINRNEESFTAGDLLKVEMSVKQWRLAEGIKVDRVVTKVLRHIQASRQIELPLVTDEPDDSEDKPDAE